MNEGLKVNNKYFSFLIAVLQFTIMSPLIAFALLMSPIIIIVCVMQYQEDLPFFEPFHRIGGRY